MRDPNKSGHEFDRHYVITLDWLGTWEIACDRCGEMARGTLTRIFSHMWIHRNCGDQA